MLEAVRHNWEDGSMPIQDCPPPAQQRSGRRTDLIDNLQLLCGACNSIKGDRPQEYLLRGCGKWR